VNNLIANVKIFSNSMQQAVLQYIYKITLKYTVVEKGITFGPPGQRNSNIRVVHVWPVATSAGPQSTDSWQSTCIIMYRRKTIIAASRTTRFPSCHEVSEALISEVLIRTPTNPC